MIELKESQRKAISKMKLGCILCGEVGTGKSRTSLAYYFVTQGGDLDKTGPEGRMKDPVDLYIITTAKKRDSLEWEDEMIPFQMSVDEGSDKVYKHKVVVDSWNNIKKYSEIEGSFFIFDEQRVVGDGKWAKTFIKIAKKNFWILLTATPGDSWKDYRAVFIANGFFHNKTQFDREHVIYSRHTTYPKIDGYTGVERLIHYRNSILIPMKSEKKTVLYDHVIWCDDYDKVLYRQVMKTRWNIYKDEPMQSASELCLVLRKVVNSCEDRVNEVIKVFLEAKRAIIFYNYDYELEILREAFSRFITPCDCWDESCDTCDKGFDSCKTHLCEGISIAEWNGHKHQPIPESKHWVYLVQYLAGAEGWNCIKTDTIIFFSQTYSYKNLIQAQGRIDRMNTPYTDLHYYHMKSHSSIDLQIAKALSEKREFDANKFTKW